MADNASTLGTITGQLAEALTPLTDRMTEDEILELLADLGFVFPPELVSQSGIGPALTNAELRVLRFLPSHLTFREIGDRLHVSANTVKTQALSAYRKLDVGSRSEAVARGRAVGLLDG